MKPIEYRGACDDFSRFCTLSINNNSTCPREVAQHAERAFVCINLGNSKEFEDILAKRRDDMSDAQKKRIDKLIRKIESMGN